MCTLGIGLINLNSVLQINEKLWIKKINSLILLRKMINIINTWLF